MRQADLNRAVARATGETVSEIAHRGFVPLIDGPSSSPVMRKLIEPRTTPSSIAPAAAAVNAAIALFMSTAPRP